MAELIVIADDLTGALDTAVQFTKKNLATTVVTNVKAAVPDSADDEVLVIDTESRHLPPAEAARRVSAAAELGKRIGARQYYKKVDSTLRGNIGAELAALLAAGLAGELMLVPAFPRLGRTVRAGRLYVDGIPLAETSLSRDPLNPIGESDIASVIAQQTTIPLRVVDDPHELPPYDGESRIYLFNAENDADLSAIGERLAAQDRLRLCAGSAGFAEILANLAASRRCRLEFAPGRPPMLIVCGSLNEISRRQIDCAVSLGYRRFSLDPGDLAANDCLKLPALKQVRNEAIPLLRGRESVILETASTCRQTTEPGGKGILALTESLGQVVKNIIDGSGLSTLVVFGGDTAIGVLEALHVERLIPLEEIAPGVAAAKTIDRRYRLHLITKAGGFGDDDLVVKIESWLKG